MINSIDQVNSKSASSGKLEKLDRQYQCVIEHLKEIVFQADIEGRWTFLNPAWESITGFSIEESLGKKYLDFVHANDRDKNHKKFIPLINGEKDECIHEIRYVKKSGDICWIEVYAGRTYDELGNITGITGTLTDVTAKRLLGDQIRKTQHLESIGFLAGGIAHDFNNLLTIVSSNLSYMESKVSINHDEELRDCVQDAIKAASKAKGLTDQLLTFSKGGAPIKEQSDIIKIVKEAAALGTSGAQIEVVYDIVGEIPQIEVDAGQISQAVHNIILNAVEAMPEDGTLNIAIAFNDKKQVRPDAPSESELQIKITDSGMGMSGEILEHLFDPYFSTKKRGSGLGLALVYSIVDKHLGRISVCSDLGKGTTVCISLPGIGSEFKRQTKSTPMSEITGGRILVLDDNEQILRSIALILRTMHFKVDTVTDGEKALEKYQLAAEEGKPFDAIISDLTIPDGMGGIETIQKIKGIDPNVVAIVSSGYSNDPVMADPQKFGFKGVLEKPYSIDKLKAVLREALC